MSNCWQLNLSNMARSFMFTSKGSLVVILKRNFKLPNFENHYAAAEIHLLPTLVQQEQQVRNEEASENSDKDLGSLKIKILKAGLNFVPEYGWTERSLALGVKSLGLSPAAHTLVDGGGPELVNYFNLSCNLKLEDHLKEISSKSQKLDLKEFVTEALEYRLRLVIPYIPKWPEAMALMLLPSHIPDHTTNMLQLVDSIWYFYGDKSLDMTWYGKRLALLAAYKASELSLIQDKSPDFAHTFDFLLRRVENVLEAGEFAETVNVNVQQLKEFGGGFLITARNLLGMKKWLK